MIASFFAGFIGVVVGAGVTAYMFGRLYAAEKAMAKEFSEKFLAALSGETKTTKKGNTVDFLSLIKTDKEKPVN